MTFFDGGVDYEQLSVFGIRKMIQCNVHINIHTVY